MGCCFSSSKQIIKDAICCDVKIRQLRGSKMNMETQLKNERLEIICLGYFEQLHPDIKILYRR